MIDPASAHSPFEAFSLIAAPALLTNATCVLAMGTVNRMLRTRDRMHELFLEAKKNPEAASEHLLTQTARVERQAVLLLHALGAIYVALGAFAGGTLMTLLGGSLQSFVEVNFQQIAVLIGLILVFVGVTSLVFGSVRLFQATQISLSNLRTEAELIRARRPVT
jgi:hypothetical protein